jgi:hypothetical protein
MPDHANTLAYGTLEAHGDTWFLRTRDGVLVVVVPMLFDPAFAHKTVSICGRRGVPSHASQTPMLIAERIVTHEVIARRACELYHSGQGGAAEDHWLRAERELLGREQSQEQSQ